MSDRLQQMTARAALLSGAGLLLLGTSHAALAQASAAPLVDEAAIQPTPTDELADDEAPGDEIVVTARNRAERLQDVPLTISALSGEQILKEGIRDLKDISFKTPALIINGGGSETLTRPSIRGLPSTSEGDPTVAIFYDGAYLPNIAANNIAMIDIDRVEVVKGPVNSLYGRAAYAGAINYISVLPTNELSGRLLGTLGNDGQRRLQGVLNLPVVDNVFMIRIAAGLDKYGGGWEDRVNGLKQGGFEKRDGQISFLFKPNETITANGRVYYGDDTFAMNPITFMEPNCGVPVTNFPPFQHLSYTCGKFEPREFEVNPDSQLPNVRGNDRKVWNSFLKLNFDMGFGDLTSLTTYSHIRQSRFQDFVGRRNGLPFGLIRVADAPLLAAAPLVGAINLTVNFGNESKTEDFAQELRFQSKAEHDVRLTAGVYYAYLTNFNSTDLGLNSDPIPAGFTIRGNATTCLLFQCDRIFLTPGGTVSQAKTAGRTTSDLFSGFAGIEVDPFQGLTVSVEGRYSMDRRDLDSIFSNSAFTVIDPAGQVPQVQYTFRPVRSALNPTGAPIHANFNYFTGRASVRYKFDQERMVYATVANGVKPGGFNPRATQAVEQAYGNEKNITYEVGFKAQMFGRMLRVNGSAFYIKLKDLQASGPSQFASNPGLITTNVGGATSKGFEVDAAFNPVRWLSLSGGVGYSDATFDEGTYDFGFAPTCVQVGPAFCDQSRVINVQSPQGNRTVYDLEGLRLQASSKWTVSLGADIDYEVSDGWSVFAGGRYRYQSRQYTGTQNLVWWGPLNRVDVRAGVEHGPFRLTAFVDNLTNNKTPDGVGLSSNLNDLAFIYQYASLPFLRRYGLTAEFKF
jgi:iron complex outermembrane receptor protein